MWQSLLGQSGHHELAGGPLHRRQQREPKRPVSQGFLSAPGQTLGGRITRWGEDSPELWQGLRPREKMQPDRSSERWSPAPAPPPSPPRPHPLPRRSRPRPPRCNRSCYRPAAPPRRRTPRAYSAGRDAAPSLRLPPLQDAALHFHRHPALGRRRQDARGAQQEGE